MNVPLDLARWSRRRFLRVLSIASGGLLFASACSEQDAAPPAPASSPAAQRLALLKRVLRAHFDYLEFDDEVLDAFARDLTRHQGEWRPRSSPPPFTRFLASTDFFQNGADESRSLHYVQYYDPYVSPCYNPFTPDAGTASTRANSSDAKAVEVADTPPSSARRGRRKNA